MIKNFVRFGDLFDYENKSKIKAGDGLQTGRYPFYTSSNELSKYLDEYSFDNTSLIFGTGGNASIHYSDAPFSVSTDCVVAIPIDESIIYPKFVFYYLSGNINLLEEGFKGAGLKHISKAFINEIQIPLPPLATQKRIAEILDAADALRRKDQELVKKYDELAQAIFIDMFGDPLKNEKGWEKVKMEKLMKIVRGGSPRPIDKFLGGKYPWIKIGDATKGDDVYLNSTREHIIEEGLSKTRLLPAGSLIFANCGVSLGFARIITFEGCIHDGWLAFSNFDDLKINKIFLLKALNSITQYFRDSAPEGIQPNLNTGIIKDFELILPPLSLQNKFELILNSFKGIKENAECNFKNSNQLFDSIIQKAFKGELVA
jgi:type I restriction enzyme, S subunit